MFPDHSAVILELIRRSGELTPSDVETLKADHAATGRSIVELVLTRELMPKPDLLRLVAEHCGMDYVEAASTNIPSDVMALVPPRLAREFRIMPWRLAGERLDVFCVDP